MFFCIDVLSYRFSLLDLNSVAKAKAASYRKGFVEPRFLSTRESELKTRREIINPNKFMYNKENMEGERVNVQHHAAMVDNIHSILSTSDTGMSPELRENLQVMHTQHKAVVDAQKK